MAIRTGRPLWGDHRPPDYRPEPPASVLAQRSPLAPSVGTSFETDENLEAQAAWLGHNCPEQSRRVAAGRISVV